MKTMIDAERLSLGYLLPTRDAVVFGRLDAAALVALGERAEQLGFEALWAGDGPGARPRHDALAMLAALAVRTERPVLATGVLLAALRPVLLLAQTVATIDQLAGGRFVLGVGAGFPLPETEAQFEAVGVPFAGRVGRLTETVGALRALWRAQGEPLDIEGRHVQLRGVALEPRTHRPHGPPVWMAGAGARAEARVGRLADGWLPYLPTPELYAESLARVEQAAAEAGRPTRGGPIAGLYATIALDDSRAPAVGRLERYIDAYYHLPVEAIGAIQAVFAGTLEQAAEWLAGYVEAGARHIVLRMADEDAERGLEHAAAVRSALIERTEDR
jgi:alkanesulfonate monooxygenase SsuD/methylene tetrahydromethanopterin reductase-like flavin-dependent oxidoreductase (luciferase family)